MTKRPTATPPAPPPPDRSKEALQAGFRAFLAGRDREVPVYWRPWRDAWEKGWDSAATALRELEEHKRKKS